jgi:putative phosphoribosyl transferase
LKLPVDVADVRPGDDAELESAGAELLDELAQATGLGLPVRDGCPVPVEHDRLEAPCERGWKLHDTECRAGKYRHDVRVAADAICPPAGHDTGVRLSVDTPGRTQLVSGPLFLDRRDAGQQLARAVSRELRPDVVIGLARGGVEVAAEVALELRVPLDALVVRKVGHPLEPEYALGAVTPGGGLYLRAHDGLGPRDIDRVVELARREADDLDRHIHGRRQPLALAGRACLLVDDGLATGATMLAATQWARARGASRVSVAAPVAPPSTVAVLERAADDVVCLAVPLDVGAVGLWYADFDQVSDTDVVALLDEAERSLKSERWEGSLRLDSVDLPATLVVPPEPSGAILFAHGSGSGHASPRNVAVARTLESAGLGTLRFDLLTPEEAINRVNVFKIGLLGSRLAAATSWMLRRPETRELPLGYFGASTGAAAALWAAASFPDVVRAVVSRGGRPDLARPRLGLVKAPTLLIVGGNDREVLALNHAAAEELRCEHEIAIVPGATHLFEEPGALDRVAELALGWFCNHIGAGPS